MQLNGKIALVTAGSRGIGAATAAMFAKHGAKVAVNGRDAAAVADIVARIRSDGGTAVAAVADCTDASALRAMLGGVERELGAVDVLAAFAGGGDNTKTLELTEEKWRAVLDGNLTSTFLTIQAVLPSMIERKHGSIVTMSSSAGRLPGMASLAYAAAKAGVVMLTGHLANEMGKHGIRVNCIAPSAILTEKNRAMIPAAMQEQMKAQFPLGRIGVPDDVANAALFLASDESAWITGVTLDVAGGRIIV